MSKDRRCGQQRICHKFQTHGTLAPAPDFSLVTTHHWTSTTLTAYRATSSPPTAVRGCRCQRAPCTPAPPSQIQGGYASFTPQLEGEYLTQLATSRHRSCLANCSMGGCADPTSAVHRNCVKQGCCPCPDDKVYVHGRGCVPSQDDPQLH